MTPQSRHRQRGPGPAVAATPLWYYALVPKDAARGLLLPLVPLFAVGQLGADLVDVGIVLAVGSLANVLGAVVWGRLADKARGKASVLTVAFVGAGASLSLAGVSADLGSYTLAIALWNFMVAASPPIAHVLAMERASRAEWPEAIARLNLVGNHGWILGLFGGAAGYWVVGQTGLAPATLFMVAAAGFIASAVILRAALPERGFGATIRDYFRHDLFESRMPEHPHALGRVTHLLPSARIWGEMRAHGREFSGSFAVYLFAVLFFFTGFACFYTPFPVFLSRDVGLAFELVFIVYGLSSVASGFTYRRAGRFVERTGIIKVQLMGLAARGAGFPVFLLLPYYATGNLGLVLATLLNAVLGVGWALINLTMMLAVPAMAPARYKGEALGLLSAFIGLGTVLGSYLGGATASEFGYAAAFVLAGLLVITGLKLVQLSGYEDNPLLT